MQRTTANDCLGRETQSKHWVTPSLLYLSSANLNSTNSLRPWELHFSTDMEFTPGTVQNPLLVYKRALREANESSSLVGVARPRI